MTRKTFYLLTFTWGLPLTLCGLLTAAALLAVGHHPRRWHGCLHFELGQGWGGLNLGPVLLTQREPHEELVAHELGHAIQNCYLGPVMLFFVLGSAIRYHYINYRGSRGKITPLYHAWWFEGQATKIGLNISNYGR